MGNKLIQYRWLAGSIVMLVLTLLWRWLEMGRMFFCFWEAIAIAFLVAHIHAWREDVLSTRERLICSCKGSNGGDGRADDPSPMGEVERPKTMENSG